MISENNIIKERRSSRGDPDQTGWLHPNIPSAADFQTHQTFPRVPAAGEHQHERHCGPSIFSPQMETMRASAQELIIWVYCFAMFVVIFGSTVYYAERCPVPAQPSWQLTVSVFRLTENPRNQFISIPNSMWWAVVTMCTVGTVNTEMSFICLVQRSASRSLSETAISKYLRSCNAQNITAKCSSYFKFISLQLLLRIWRYGAQNRPRHGCGSRVCHCR